MLAKHFDHKPAFSFAWAILHAHIAAIDAQLTSACIIGSTFEDRLQCSIV